jgi:putative membrane protein
MTRSRLFCLLFAASLAGPALARAAWGPASAPAASAKSQSAPLASFAREAATGGMSEVELGRLAVERGTDPAVKAFGQQMVDDHSKANVELQTIAAQAGVTLPGQIDPKEKATYAKLSALSGAAFDRAYIDDMIKDHKADVAAFEKASRAPGDSPFKKFAADKLPTLREHLKMAESARASLEKGATSGSGAGKR